MNSKTILGTAANCSYTVEQGVVCIIDQGGGRSVTNDAEAVISSLLREGIDPAPRHFIYRDTTGQWDELVVRNGRFHSFRLLRMRDKQAAITAVKRPPDRVSRIRRMLGL